MLVRLILPCLLILFVSISCQVKPTPVVQKPATALLQHQLTKPSIATPLSITTTPVIVGEKPTPMKHIDWLSYTNINYGFTFQYPPHWKLLEQDNKEPHYIKFSIDNLVLIIGYKWGKEEENISGGGGALPGSLQTTSYTELLGQPIPKILLVNEGKVKSLFYNGINAEIPVQKSLMGLVLSIRMIPISGSDYHTIDISETVLKEIDNVIDSFVLGDIKTSTPTFGTTTPINQNWRVEENPAYGFLYQHPQNWLMEEQKHLIKLSQGSISLLIGYRFEDENVNLGPEEIPPGMLQSSNSLSFLGQNINKQILLYNNKQKAVVYNGTAGINFYHPYKNKNIKFVILLYDFQLDYDAVDIPASSQEVADQIVASFQLTPVGQPTPAVHTPTPTTFVLGAPTWKDNFDSGENWYLLQTANTSFSVKNGQLIMQVSSPQLIEEWGSANITGLNDFYLEGNFINGNDCAGLDRYGFIFRTLDTTRGYVVNFSCDGRYRLYLWDGNQYIPLIQWTPSSAIRSGVNQKNTLGISAIGNTIELYANRTQLASLTDETYAAGGIGLLVGSSETQNYSVFVEDVSYWKR